MSLTREMNLGRTTEADIQLPSGTVSRRHTRIVASAGGFCVNDLGSSNGTYVNGQPVTSHRLQDGDVLSVGEFKLLYRQG